MSIKSYRRTIAMASKADYLKKYISSEAGDSGGKKKKIRMKKRANLAILDDDVDWRSTVPKDDRMDDDPEEAPAVAEVHDEAAPKKWQPLKGTTREAESRGASRSPGRQRDVDLSPPRRGHSVDRSARDRHATPDANSPRTRKSEHHEKHAPRGKRARHDSPETGDLLGSTGHDLPHPGGVPDVSPPRRPRTPDASPPRRQHGTPDASPPRRPMTPDASPPRRGNPRAPDASPPRRGNPRTPDASPPRRGHPRAPDASPPQRRTHGANPPPRRDQNPYPDKRRPHGRPPSPQVLEDSERVKMASGGTSGLQTSEQLRLENMAARENQATLYKDLAPEVSGKGAETVYRDKEGKRLDPKLERLKKRQEEREKMENDAQFMEWGRG